MTPKVVKQKTCKWVTISVIHSLSEFSWSFISLHMTRSAKDGHPSYQACSFLPISWFLGGNLLRLMQLGYNYSLLSDIFTALHAPATVQEPCWVWEKTIPLDQYLWLYYLSASADPYTNCLDGRRSERERRREGAGGVKWGLCSCSAESEVQIVCGSCHFIIGAVARTVC